MKISTICVSWNAAKTIRFTIDSFLKQSHPDKELIVVDGISTDGTLDIVRSYNSPSIHLHIGKDKGIYDAMNKGLALYSGDAVGFLNSDDAYHDPESLGLISCALENAQMVSGHVNLVPDHLSGKVAWVRKATTYQTGAFQKNWVLPHPSTYARRSVYDSVGSFDIRYRMAADYDWILRAIEIHKFECVVLDKVLVDMQAGGLSNSGFKASITNIKETLRSRQKWLGSGFVDRAVFERVWGRVRRILG